MFSHVFFDSTVVALLPPSIYNIMIVIGLTSWMGTTRFVRAEFLALRDQDFVAAARSQAIPEWRIIFIHMVPNAIAPVMVSATLGVASAILTESALSFLGFGVQPPDATWGNILSDGKNFLFDAPWLTFIPGFTILLVVLAFNLCGDGLLEAFNPIFIPLHFSVCSAHIVQCLSSHSSRVNYHCLMVRLDTFRIVCQIIICITSSIQYSNYHLVVSGKRSQGLVKTV